MRLLMFLLVTAVCVADVPPIRPAPPAPRLTLVAPAHRKGSGKWYMSADGHAVFCFGPTMLVKADDGSLQKVATFCQNDKPIVVLHD